MSVHTFNIPAAINGEQLREELGADSVYINEDSLYIVGNLTEAQAQSGIDAHIPVAPKVPTAAEKLFAATGLTVAEYKALGL